MADALLKACPEPGCPELVATGRCLAHTKQGEQRRGSSASRGYGAPWVRFRTWFMERLIREGIAPVCGAALPDGPAMPDSQCRADGRLEGRRLHLDHTPPLRPEERRDRRAVCDPRRVGLLCAACHSRKTLREQR